MILNKSETKKQILAMAKNQKAHEYTRVADEVFPYLEEILRREITKLIEIQPSRGKTIYSPHYKR